VKYSEGGGQSSRGQGGAQSNEGGKSGKKRSQEKGKSWGRINANLFPRGGGMQGGGRGGRGNINEKNVARSTEKSWICPKCSVSKRKWGQPNTVTRCGVFGNPRSPPPCERTKYEQTGIQVETPGQQSTATKLGTTLREAPCPPITVKGKKRANPAAEKTKMLAGNHVAGDRFQQLKKAGKTKKELRTCGKPPVLGEKKTTSEGDVGAKIKGTATLPPREGKDRPTRAKDGRNCQLLDGVDNSQGGWGKKQNASKHQGK